MATSDGYAQTGYALHWLLQHGHAGLSDIAGDLVMATRARDQVLTNLFFSGLYIVGATHESVEFGADDMLRHPVRGLTEMLRRTPASRLEGPAPTDVLRAPPTHPAAQAWVAAADASEKAAHSISRARPEQLTVQAWERTRPGDDIVVGEPIGGTAGDPFTPSGAVAALLGNHVAWSLTADVAAIAGTVTILNDQLAAELERGATIHGARSLAAAARRLRTSAVDDLRVMSSLVLRLSEAGPLLPAYDLRPASPRAAALRSPWHIGAALDRTIELLDGAQTLTAPQQRALAGSMASVAHRLSTVLPPPAAKALDELASKQVLFAAQWTHTAISATTDGNWQAPTQLAQVAKVLNAEGPGWVQAPPDPELIGYLTRSAQRLPTIVRMTADNLRTGLTAGHFLTPSSQPEQPFEPVPPRLRWRVQVEATTGELVEAAGRLRSAVGPSLPPQLVAAGRLPRASVLLRDAALQPAPRPNHPAVFPGRHEQRLPRRRR
ncbi:hypothetical protein [Kineosporia sp. A_224]|uniref:hypothetical protein n=1 Tax=Kineosporia sp. A_224 TaxID=1962180 RepID=UPI000B4C171F|nr:hypothetical protein [Kineosporia sp. A_224]